MIIHSLVQSGVPVYGVPNVADKLDFVLYFIRKCVGLNSIVQNRKYPMNVSQIPPHTQAQIPPFANEVTQIRNECSVDSYPDGIYISYATINIFCDLL